MKGKVNILRLKKKTGGLKDKILILWLSGQYRDNKVIKCEIKKNYFHCVDFFFNLKVSVIICRKNHNEAHF